MAGETAARLSLRLLDTTSEVIAPTKWIDLLGELWEPFITDSHGPSTPDCTFEITSRKDVYEVGFADDEKLMTNDPWTAILRMRVCLGKAAIDGATHLQGLHGAVLGSDAGAIILSGKAGAGKSTLCVDLALNGLTFGGDDVFGLDLATGHAVPLPLPPAFKNVGLWTRFAGLWGRPTWLGQPTEAFVVPPSVFRSVVSEPSPIAAVALLARDTSARPATETVSIAEAAVEFAGESNHLSPAALRKVVATLDKSDVFRIRYGLSIDAGDLLTARLALAASGK